VSLHVWRVRSAPRALWRMALDPRRVRALPGVRFAKLLGTGRGSDFGAAAADPRRWAALTVWGAEPTPAQLDAVAAPWRRIATAECRLTLRPLAARGTWAGRRPFDDPAPTHHDGPVAVLTRARLRPAGALRFWRSIGPVAAGLAQAEGLLAAFGVGEAPVGWQGTVSVWRGSADVTAFAYRHPRHVEAVAETPVRRWYAEELFARFAVVDVDGDRGVVGWRERERT
jgi:hypothetical protein